MDSFKRCHKNSVFRMCYSRRHRELDTTLDVSRIIEHAEQTTLVFFWLVMAPQHRERAFCLLSSLLPMLLQHVMLCRDATEQKVHMVTPPDSFSNFHPLVGKG